MALLLGACGDGARTADAPTSSAPTTTVGATAGTEVVAVPANTTPPTSATTTTAPPEVVRTLAFGGDLLTHMPLVAVAQRNGAVVGAPYDFGPMLAPMAPILGGVDLALCHLEVPLVGDGQAVSGYPSFHAPRELATAVAGAGYDGCSTASNHSLDGGRPAIDATLATFDGLGLGHVGTARSPDEDLAPRLYPLDGAVVAHLSYAYGFNGYEPPADAPWVVDRIDPAVIARDAAAARAAGADLVVVSLHWGTEYQHEPDAFQRDTAAAVTAIGDVDLVIGHHAHVVQPIEQVGGTWVVFGLGNQLSNQAEDVKRDGLTVVVTVAGPAGGRLAVRSIEAVPTYVDLSTYAVLPTAATLARPDLDPGLRAALEASQARTMATVNAAGAQVPPPPVTRRVTLLVALAVVLVVAAAVGIGLRLVDGEAEPEDAAPETPCVVAVPASHPSIIDGGTSIATISADGTTTLLTGEDVANDPDISPDGRRIAYVHVIGDYESSGPERTEVWTMGIDGSDPARVVTDGAYQEAPAWSPDGERIAFARQDRRRGVEVVVVPVAGGAATVVARPAADDRAKVSSIDWSPDGRRLAYLWSGAGLGDDGTEVRVVDLDGSDARTLAEQPRLASVDWHPDGSSLLVSAFDDADVPLQLIDVADGATTALPHEGDLARWSADGTRIYAIVAVVAVVGVSGRWELVELPGPDDPDGAVRTIGPADFPTFGMSVGPGC